MKDILKNIFKEEAVEYIIRQYPTPRHLIHATEQELQSIPSVGKVKVKEIRSILDLTLSALESSEEGTTITSPRDVFSYLRIASFYEEENFIGIYLDTKNRIIDTLNISKGSLNSSIVHPREFFSPAIRLKAASTIAVHNHPSTNPEPSIDDIETTKRLVDAGQILGIKLLDHIIIGGNTYCSLKEKGMI